MNEKNELKQIIYESFDSVPYPGDKNIVEDFPWEDAEREAVLIFFKGKSWRDVKYSKLNRDYQMDPSACLSFMSEQAYRYYLPAFLLICLDNYEEADVIVDNVIYSLTPPSGDHSAMNKFISKMSGFTIEQKLVISSFLKYFERFHGDDFPQKEPFLALNRYWGEY